MHVWDATWALKMGSGEVLYLIFFLSLRKEVIENQPILTQLKRYTVLLEQNNLICTAIMNHPPN